MGRTHPRTCSFTCLAACTHRVAIWNQCILAFDGESVTLRYRDYEDGDAQGTRDREVGERAYAQARIANARTATIRASPACVSALP